MKTFVQYLLDHNIVPAAALALAMNEQVRSLKTPAEVCFENKLLSDDQYVRVLLTQAETAQSFKMACEVEGIWTEELGQKIRALSEAHCPSLSDLLVQHGSATAAQLESAAQAFQAGTAPLAPEVSTPASAPSSGLSSLLQEQILPKLEPYVQVQPWTTTQLKVCYHLLHQLVGIARFANAPTLEELAKKTEDVFATACASEPVPADTLALCSNQIGLLVMVLRESVAPSPMPTSSLDSFFDNLKNLEQRLQPQAA